MIAHDIYVTPSPSTWKRKTVFIGIWIVTAALTGLMGAAGYKFFELA